MKFLILNFLFLVFSTGNANTCVDLSTNFDSYEEEVLLSGGTVVITDEILLRVNTSNASVIVSNIEIFDQSENLVMQVQGCNLQECLADISSLGAGTYDVVVTTNNNYSFSGAVTLN